MTSRASPSLSSWSILGSDRLEDERWWAIVFGAVTAVTALLVSTYRVDSDSVPYLLLLSLPVVVGYWLRGATERVPAWTLPLLAGAAQVGVIGVDEQAEGHAFLVLVALFYSFFRERRRRLALVGLACTVPIPLLLFELDLSDSDGWLYWTMGYLVCAWFGIVAHQLRSLAQELEQRRGQAAVQAVSEERRRIAGDVHDLVGHSLSVMMLQLTGARRIIGADPDRAADAIDRAEGVGREAMAEIRRTIGMLRERGVDAAPVPGIADLPALVAPYREAGGSIALTSTGSFDGIETTRGVTVYRIVQEAIANAVKHNVDARIDVSVRDESDGLHVRIVNSGGRSGNQSHSIGPGFGVVGMRERARSVGGSLTAGPVADGWLVDAHLPPPTSDERQTAPGSATAPT